MIEKDWLLKLKYCLIINPSLIFQFLFAANLFQLSIDLQVQHSELYTAYYYNINNLHIKIWGLPLLMEKWFYCQYGTCRMVKCFHIMNALLDRIHDLTKVIIFIKIVKLCITVNYADLPHGMGKGISDSQK